MMMNEMMRGTLILTAPACYRVSRRVRRAGARVATPTPCARRSTKVKRAPHSAEIEDGSGAASAGRPEMAKKTEEYAGAERAVAPARILIVEDNPLNRLLIHDVLELRGHEVVEAATVDEARRALASMRPDLLLLDVQIPGGGGEAIIREVRKRADLNDLPIVAVTSLAMPGDRERLLSIGFQGYLSKPIDTRTFGAAIESYLKPDNAERGRLRVSHIG